MSIRQVILWQTDAIKVRTLNSTKTKTPEPYQKYEKRNTAYTKYMHNVFPETYKNHHLSFRNIISLRKCFAN